MKIFPAEEFKIKCPLSKRDAVGLLSKSIEPIEHFRIKRKSDAEFQGKIEGDCFSIYSIRLAFRRNEGRPTAYPKVTGRILSNPSGGSIIEVKSETRLYYRIFIIIFSILPISLFLFLITNSIFLGSLLTQCFSSH